MTKECPHCHENSFGWRELIFLNSFDPEQCKSCHQLVRNSGWRQILAPLAVLSMVVTATWVSNFIPADKGVFLLPIAVILVPLALVLIAKPVPADAPSLDPPAFKPNPDNDKSILIQGWNEDELRQILDDFVEEDMSAFAAFRIELQQGLENSFSLTFPEDVHPSEFLSLINYLAYPINFDPAGRCITVAGKTTLNSDFDGLPKSIEGAKAILYLPENDEDYDVVYLQTQSGTSFAKSFDQGVWRRATDARLSSAARLLAS
jgi:hypothetical protein